LHVYADHFLRHTAIRIERPRFLDHAIEWIWRIEEGRPGFVAALRTVALAALREDAVAASAAVGALAVVGQPEDVDVIHRAATRFGGRVKRDAMTATFEITHRRVRPP
jgi:hypothetical protein